MWFCTLFSSNRDTVWNVNHYLQSRRCLFKMALFRRWWVRVNGFKRLLRSENNRGCLLLHVLPLNVNQFILHACLPRTFPLCFLVSCFLKGQRSSLTQETGWPRHVCTFRLWSVCQGRVVRWHLSWELVFEWQIGLTTSVFQCIWPQFIFSPKSRRSMGVFYKAGSMSRHDHYHSLDVHKVNISVS